MNELNHVAVIADGNGRWAERRGLERSAGHEQGLNKVEDMMHWCVDMGIPALSVYCFSWENWSLPRRRWTRSFPWRTGTLNGIGNLWKTTSAS